MSDRKGLEALRAELDLLDSTLFEAVSARSRIVSKIADLKKSSGQAVFDRERERVVVQRHLSQGVAAGLTREESRMISKAVLASSHRLQAKQVSHSTTSRRFLLVGGKGGMGQFLRRELLERGHAVEVVDKEEDQVVVVVEQLLH